MTSLESKCSPCTRQSYKDITRVEACGENGYYITYTCGHRNYISTKRLEVEEELGVGSLTKEDYQRIMGEKK